MVHLACCLGDWCCCGPTVSFGRASLPDTEPNRALHRRILPSLKSAENKPALRLFGGELNEFGVDSVLCGC